MSPIQRNGAKGWQWLLAGLLFTADGSLPDRRPLIVGELQLRIPTPQKVDSVGEDGIMGLMAMPHVTDAEVRDTAVEGRVETCSEVMGTMAMIVLDSVPAPPEDTTALMQLGSRQHPAHCMAVGTW